MANPRAMAMAYEIMRRNKVKKMSEGGEVKEDFLSASQDDSGEMESLENETYPDPENTEHEINPKKSLSRVMEMVRKRHMAG